jgi:hypothetical protein
LQCAEFPCKKYEDREKIERDSFVSHKRIFHNHDLARQKQLVPGMSFPVYCTHWRSSCVPVFM